jgi:adenylate cyclase
MSRHVQRLGLVVIAAIAVLCVIALARSPTYAILRERAFDAILTLARPPESRQIAVVDIDRASLAEIGPWPWKRDRIAELLEHVAAQAPKAVAIDILLTGHDEGSPAALARELQTSIDDPFLEKLAALRDGDDRLGAAIGTLKTVVGVALDPQKESKLIASAPILLRDRVELDSLWQAPGLIAPLEKLRDPASGLGVLAMPGDPDGNVRRIPLLAASRAQVVPGLAVELLRVGKDASAFVLSGSEPLLSVGDQKIALGNDAMLRLAPSVPETWSDRTIAAADLMKSRVTGQPLAGKLVLIGSSAPEVGGLRPAHGGMLVPSVQLHAQAVSQILSGAVPLRSAGAQNRELWLAGSLAAAGIALGTLLPPSIGIVFVTIIGLIWIVASFLFYEMGKILIDPLLGPVALASCYFAAALSAAAQARRRAAAIRRRFEQHLAPAVVRRIVDHPGLLKLEGELRTVTALFTDVEGFTAMSERSEPHRLVRVLDRYFDGLSQIIVDHGGMVDKIIGDAICAIFNAPLDLPDHPKRAFECALALENFASDFRARREPAALSFGRTRIGLETGPAIVGDVGGRRKLDYTAHGTTINTAARLEAANKTLGTTICLGSGIAALLPPGKIRPLGTIELRGRSARQAVFSPWPKAFTPADQQAYLAAIERAKSDKTSAATELASIGARLGDRATSLLAERLHAEDGAGPDGAIFPHALLKN